MRQSSRQRRAHSVSDSAVPLTFDVVVRLMVTTGHLGAMQLGRLCRVCSTWRAAALDDEAWAHLCHSRWANTVHVPRSVLQLKGHRWLYAQRLKTWSQPPLPPLAPPSIGAEQLILLVDISLAGVPKLSTGLTGATLEPFLSTGSIDLPLTEPIRLGEPKLSSDGQWDMEFASQPQWDAAVHLLRTTDQKCVCLFSYESASWDQMGIVTPPKDLDAKNIDWKRVEPDPVRVDLSSEPLPGLELNDYGTKIAQRLKNFEGLYFDFSTEIKLPLDARYFGFQDMLAGFRELFEGRGYSMADFHCFSRNFWERAGEQFSLDDSDEELDAELETLKQHFRRAQRQPAKAKQLQISSFTLLAWQQEGGGVSSVFQGEEHGVTLSHLLQGLRAWDDD